jgi:hypothetical protein
VPAGRTPAGCCDSNALVRRNGHPHIMAMSRFGNGAGSPGWSPGSQLAARPFRLARQAVVLATDFA